MFLEFVCSKFLLEVSHQKLAHDGGRVAANAGTEAVEVLKVQLENKKGAHVNNTFILVAWLLELRSEFYKFLYAIQCRVSHT